MQTIQNTKSAPGQTPGVRSQKLDGEDFFNSTQTEPQTAGFSLPKPPKWLERPVGASFGFGGKVVSFAPVDAPSRKSKVRISHFAVDGGVGTAMKDFEKALAEGDLTSICQSRIAEAKTEEEKADWEVIQSLISDNPRKKLVEYLGFSDDKDEESESASKLETKGDEVKEHLSPIDRLQANGPRNHRLSLFFDSGDSDNFLSGLSSTKGAKTNNPFQIYTGSESTADKQITKAVLLGQFEKALDICLREDRMSDAFMVAICGGQKCIEKAQAAYLGKQSKGPNYLRLLASIVGKNLWDVVYNADLSNWKEVMATLCTFADKDEFPDLCEALGDRLEESKDNKTEARKNASFCYLAGSKLEKVVAIWIEETQEDEVTGLQEGNADSTFSLHARSLQSLIEKVTVFREVTKFEDPSNRTQSSDWKLAPLYDKYAEYADVAAAHGSLEVAEKYLDLLPAQYAAAEVARNRVKQATRKAPAQPVVKQTTSTTRQPARNQPTVPVMQQQQGPIPSGAARSYAPNMPVQPSTQSVPATTSSYTPVGYQQPQVQQQNLGVQQPYGGYYQGQGVGAPPHNLNASPSIPPPSRATDTSNWNDTPMVTKPAMRRGTPGAAAAPITSPFPNQQQQNFPTSPPGAPYIMQQQKATPPLPPPPKGPAPPLRMSSPQTGSQPFQHQVQSQYEGPPSATRSQYAPPLASQSGGAMQPPAVPRGASPYNPPPAGATPSNRYAPAAPQQNMTPADLQGRPLPPGPPGHARPGPPSNAYAPQQSQYSAPPPQQGQPYTNTSSPQYGQGPPQGIPQDNLSGSRPESVSSQRPTAPTPSTAQSKYRK